jgi:hypothetical protein
MKKITFFLVFVLITVFGFSQSYVEIGAGTVSTSYPVYSVWNYGWYSAIYPQSAVGAAKSITKIAVNCINGPKTMSNQKIYLGHSSASIFSTANYDDPTTAGYILVYSGAVNFNGWTEITLTTPFSYNGIDNLVVQWENRSGSSSYANFNSTTSTTNNNKGSGSDASFPTVGGYLNPYPSSLPNIRFYYTSSMPATPANPVPVSGLEKTDLNTGLQVTLGTNTTSYDLYFGTDSLQVSLLNVADKIVSNAAVGAPGNFNYNFASILNPGTKYFWCTVAKSGTNSTAGPVWKFTTQNVIQTFPYVQDFQGTDIFFPGWYGYYTDWTYPTTGNAAIWNCPVNAVTGDAVLQGSSSLSVSSLESSIMTPRFFLPSNFRAKYVWRNGNFSTSKTAGRDTTFFEITSNGGATWIKLDTLSPASVQTNFIQRNINVSAYAGNNVYFRWHYKQSVVNADNVLIDNFLVEAIPSGPVAGFSTDVLNFSPIAMNAHTKLPIIVENTGTTPLVISGVTVAAPFSCNFTGSIVAGATDTMYFVFNGTSVGSFNGTATINHNAAGGSTDISLSGTAGDLISSFNETFESTNVEEIPAGWSKLRSADPYQTYNDIVVKNSPSDAHSVPNAIRLYNNSDTISPLILLTPGLTNFNGNTLTFWAAKTYLNYQDVNLIVGLMDDPYDASSFEPIQTIALNDAMTQYTVNFNASQTKPYIAFRHGELRQIQAIWIDDIQWQGTVIAVPAPTSLVFPADVSVDNEKNLSLQWTPNTGSPTGYKLYLGTDYPPSNLVNGTDLGNVLSYDVSNLNYSTSYYWKIVPYNAFGDAIGCPTWSFQTMNDPTLTVPWSQNFDALVQTSGATYPLGWSTINCNDQSMYWDMISNSTSNPDNAHSAPNAMNTAFTFLNPLDDWLISPPVQLTAGTNYTLSFWLKAPVYNDGTNPPSFEKFAVAWGNDNTAAALTNIVYQNEHLQQPDYIQILENVNVPSDGKYYVGFHVYSDPLQWLLMVDDVSMDISDNVTPATRNGISIYPNPADTYINISANQEIESAKNISVSVYNITGQIVLRKSGLTIPISELTSGMYIIDVSADNNHFRTVFNKK